MDCTKKKLNVNKAKQQYLTQWEDTYNILFFVSNTEEIQQTEIVDQFRCPVLFLYKT